ncbi:MAG TPA: proprotein convertase P-domain-containing protein, partial [Gemmataceae bacterium]|nr:proprotein convertase P-domain-containing protein [Gemmataceae bacterium]
GSAPFSGTYRPETSLAAFDGTNARGTWTLEVYDAASRSNGKLTAFTLILTGTNGGQMGQAFGFAEGTPFHEPVLLVFAPVVVVPPQVTFTPSSPVVDYPAAFAAAFLFDPVEERRRVVESQPVDVQSPPAREEVATASATRAEYPPLYAMPGVADDGEEELIGDGEGAEVVVEVVK